MIDKCMKVRVTCYPRKSVEMRCEAWDEISENGVIVFNLSNQLAMFRVQLSKLSVELLGMSVCYEELGCTCGECVMVCSSIVTWSEISSEDEVRSC